MLEIKPPQFATLVVLIGDAADFILLLFREIVRKEVGQHFRTDASSLSAKSASTDEFRSRDRLQPLMNQLGLIGEIWLCLDGSFARLWRKDGERGQSISSFLIPFGSLPPNQGRHAENCPILSRP